MGFTIPQCARDYLKAAGYAVDTSMTAEIDRWWEWYTATAGWYDRTERQGDRTYKTTVSSLHPARRVCREWAATILDDDGTRFTVDAGDPVASESATANLAAWMGRTRFVPEAQMCVERAFATGTGALALWFDVRDGVAADIRARRYDARMIVPLTWDDDGVTECAFCTVAHLSGRKVYQLQVHALDPATGTYHVRTALFDDGMRVAAPGVIDDLDTGSAEPTFCVLKPALDNVREDGTAYGQSVFADAVDAIRGVDGAWDSIQREVSATKVKVFMSDDLFDVVETNNSSTRIVPMAPEDTVIRKVAGNGRDQMLEVFSPEIRLQPLREALNVAWAEVGDIVGFGKHYLRMDRDGGAKTAREVSSDNAAFARNVKKHENALRPGLEGLLACLCRLQGWAGDGCRVTVNFDDSVISDTESEKTMALAEVGGGVMAPYEYRMRFYGEDEETAKARAEEAGAGSVGDAVDLGTMA